MIKFGLDCKGTTNQYEFASKLQSFIQFSGKEPT